MLSRGKQIQFVPWIRTCLLSSAFFPRTLKGGIVFTCYSSFFTVDTSILPSSLHFSSFSAFFARRFSSLKNYILLKMRMKKTRSVKKFSFSIIEANPKSRIRRFRVTYAFSLRLFCELFFAEEELFRVLMNAIFQIQKLETHTRSRDKYKRSNPSTSGTCFQSNYYLRSSMAAAKKPTLEVRKNSLWRTQISLGKTQENLNFPEAEL